MTGENHTVLIVEDDPRFRQILRDAVRERLPSAVILEAADWHEGDRLAREQDPDVAILDVGLPDGSGLELARRVKQSSPETLVIVCTMSDSPEYRDAAHRLGALFWSKGRLSPSDFVLLPEEA